MKLKESTNTVLTLGKKEDRRFKMSDNKILYDILRNKLYNNPIGAICREIASNCRDANRESGRPDEPIIIKIFDNIDGMRIGDASISFKDSGIGINPDRMQNVFLLYGESTKRDSNGYTGGYGLGAKTPFAYSESFTIITVCEENGCRTKYTYIGHLDQEEKGAMPLFKKEKTNDPTGTEVIVPIKKADIDKFETNCYYYTRFWNVRPIYTGFKRSDVYSYEKYSFGKFDIYRGSLASSLSSFVVMIDEIPYNVPTSLIKDDWDSIGGLSMISFPFDNGVLDLGAAREDIQINDHNKQLIEERIEFLKDTSKKRLNYYFSSKNTIAQAIIGYNILKSIDRMGSMGNIDYVARVLSRFVKDVKWQNKTLRGDYEFTTYNFKIISNDIFNGTPKIGQNDFRRDGIDAYLRVRGKDDSKVDAYQDYSRDRKRMRRVYAVTRNGKYGILYNKLSKHKELRKVLIGSAVDVNDGKYDSLYGSYPTEAELEDAFVNHPKLKIIHDEYMITSLMEDEMMLELFEMKRLEDVEPMNYNVVHRAKKDANTSPITIHAKKHTITGLSGYSFHPMFMKGKELKKFNKVILFNKKDLKNGWYDRETSELKVCVLLTHVISTTGYEVCSVLSSYKTMVAHSATPYKEFVSMLSVDDVAEFKKLLFWSKIPNFILRLAHDSSDMDFDEDDKKVLNMFVLKRIPNDTSYYKDIKSVIKKTPTADINKVFPDMSITTAEDASIKTFIEKYPMLKLCEDATYSSDMKVLVNDYIKTVQLSIKAKNNLNDK